MADEWVETDGPVNADADDYTDSMATCRHHRIPLWPGQKPARCIKPAGHWPETDHEWQETT